MTGPGLVWTNKTSLRVWYEMQGHSVVAEEIRDSRLCAGFAITPEQARRMEAEFEASLAGDFERRRRRVVDILKSRGTVMHGPAGKVG